MVLDAARNVIVEILIIVILQTEFANANLVGLELGVKRVSSAVV